MAEKAFDQLPSTISLLKEMIHMVILLSESGEEAHRTISCGLQVRVRVMGLGLGGGRRRRRREDVAVLMAVVTSGMGKCSLCKGIMILTRPLTW